MSYNLVYQELLSMIKRSEISFEIKKSLEDVYSDKELIEKINKYKETQDETLKKEIYNNEKFTYYKRLENELNLLILKLNNIFKERMDW